MVKPAHNLSPSVEADIHEPSATLAPIFIAAVDDHGATVVRIVRRCGVLDSERLAVASDVFLTAWRCRHTFDRRRAFKPWLLGIARRVCSDYRKHERTTQEFIVPGEIENMAAGDGLDPESLVIAREGRELLDELIAGLPPQRRDPVVLHLEGFTTAEIAAELGILPNTAYARVKLAFRDIEQEMERRRARAQHLGRRRLLLLPLAELLRLDAAAGPEFNSAARHQLIETVRAELPLHGSDATPNDHGDDATSDSEGSGEGGRGRTSAVGDYGATARSPSSVDLPAHSWIIDGLARLAPLGRLLLPQLPAFALGAATVIAVQAALSREHAPAAATAPVYAEYAAASAALSAAIAPTTGAGVPPIHAAMPAGSATSTASIHGGARPNIQQILDLANAQNRSDNPDGAHKTLKRLDRAASGQQDEDLAMMEIDSLLLQGRRPAAERAARAFRMKYPNSLMMPRLDAALGKSP